MDLPTLITTNGDLPIYLQLKYQLLHLISSGALGEGSRLPPVRSLAEHLNINPGTVAQAYKELQAEGLVEGQKGRGTFVLPITDPDVADYAVRQRLLSEALERDLGWAYALGFSDSEIQQSVVALLSRHPQRRHMAFVGYVERGARKYADRLTQYLAEFELEVASLTIDEVEAGERSDLLAQVYYVFTFAGLVQRLEEALRDRPRPFRVIGIVVEVTSETVKELSQLPEDAEVVVLTEKRYLHGALNLIQRYSRVPIAGITTLYHGDDDTDLRRAHGCDVLLYTLHASDTAEALAHHVGRSIELSFDISEDSLLKLRRMFSPSARQG